MQFSLFQRRREDMVKPAPPRGIGLDFHSHLLPGVDDGVADIPEALAAIAALQSAGFIGGVITPHIYPGMFDNEPGNLREQFAVFTKELAVRKINFPLFLAAEYFADERFLQQIRESELLYFPVGTERWVLVEFPYFQEDQMGAICLSTLAARGYRPVVAHVERYRYVAKGRSVWLSRFARAGAILQADIGSLAGQHGEEVRRFCRWLQAENHIRIWGSDLHKPQQVEQFIKPGLKKLGAFKRLNECLNRALPELAA